MHCCKALHALAQGIERGPLAAVRMQNLGPGEF